MIQKKLKLSGAMLINGWASYFGLYYIPEFSLIFLMIGFISIIYSMILNLQLIDFHYLQNLIKIILYLSFLLVIFLIDFRWLIIISTMMFITIWWSDSNGN